MLSFPIHQTDSHQERDDHSLLLEKERQSLEPRARIEGQVPFNLVWTADGKVITIK